jgi:hypothetical protein
MRKPAILLGLVIGAGVAVCAPDILAYRRLAGITRTLREDMVTARHGAESDDASS